VNSKETQDNQQQQQREYHDLLRSERKARGELLNAHLEAGREQARSDNARARERTLSVPPSLEDTSDDDYEAERKTRKEAVRASMKAEARGQYEGSDDAFERDWPDIREKLIMETLEKDLKEIRRGL
jgi:hypothetical protein